MSMSNKKVKFATSTDGRAVVVRHSASGRFNHWVTGMAFIVASLSGLAFFHPNLSWLYQIFGSGTWARILHPFFGLLMAVNFFGLAYKYGKHNFINKNDVQWMKQIADVIAARNEKLPPIGMYNGGQKVLFWVLMVLTIGLMVTGVVIWREYFTFSADVKAVAVLLHALMAFTMMGFITIHVLAAILAKGSIGAMLHGKVTYAWAKHHHSQWYKDIVAAEEMLAIKK